MNASRISGLLLWGQLRVEIDLIVFIFLVFSKIDVERVVQKHTSIIGSTSSSS